MHPQPGVVLVLGAPMGIDELDGDRALPGPPPATGVLQDAGGGIEEMVGIGDDGSDARCARLAAIPAAA